jgi:hypothetical protein
MSNKYFWTIDKDHIEGTADGLSCGSGDRPERSPDTTTPGEQFRMFDDDGELYYSGSIWGDYDGFEPLDDFGMPSAGCTGIQYQNDKGEWEWL